MWRKIGGIIRNEEKVMVKVRRRFKVRSVIAYAGGKGNMVGKILKLFPPHHTYVEPFGGGASLLLNKEPSPVEVYNDRDSGLVNFFRILRDPRKFKKFYRKVFFTPYSREEREYCKETWKSCEDAVEKAYRWFVAIRQSFSGDMKGGWGFNVTTSAGGMARACSAWLSVIEELPLIHERFKRVQIEHKDFREIIKLYDTEDTLFYNDPPYIPETRKDKKLYNHELTLEDHKDLVNLLLNIKGKCILSGYKHPVYEPLENAGWKRINWATACHLAGRTRATGIRGKGSALLKAPRIESVWISPNCIRPSMFSAGE